MMSEYPSDKKLGPDPVDVALGDTLRRLRKARRISQSKLGNAIGITFQQVQKYERAANRISASRLYSIAVFFGVSPLLFFPGTTSSLEDTGGSDSWDLSPEALRLARAFDAVKSRSSRRVIASLIAVTIDQASRESVGDDPSRSVARPGSGRSRSKPKV